MKRIALIAGGVVAVLIVGVFVVLSTIDVNQYKGVVEEQAAHARHAAAGSLLYGVERALAVDAVARDGHQVTVGKVEQP